MPELNLITSAVKSRSVVASGGNIKNLFAEINEDQSITLYGTSGKVAVANVGLGGAIRGMIAANNFLYVVCESTVYRIDAAYVVTTIGTINTSTGLVSMASNGLDVIIVDGLYGYLVNFSTGLLSRITAADFPNGVKYVDYLNGIYLVSGNNTQYFYGSARFDGTSWNALDVGVADYKPDNLIRPFVNGSDLLNFGTVSIEYWSDTGAADFPIERSGNAFLDVGVLAANSITRLGSSVLFLGQTSQGNGVVYQVDGYSPKRISNHAIEYAIGQWTNASTAYAWAYSEEGHNFYVLSCVGCPESLVFDITTNMWHTRTWFNDGQHFSDRANTYAFFNGKHIVGDFDNGNIYELSLDVYVDDVYPIVREFTSQHTVTGKRAFYSLIELRMESGVGLSNGQGSDPLINLSTSEDNGRTWGSERQARIGALGEYLNRIYWPRVGSGFNKSFRIRMSDPVKVALTGARLEYTQ